MVVLQGPGSSGSGSSRHPSRQKRDGKHPEKEEDSGAGGDVIQVRSDAFSQVLQWIPRKHQEEIKTSLRAEAGAESQRSGADAKARPARSGVESSRVESNRIKLLD